VNDVERIIIGKLDKIYDKVEDHSERLTVLETEAGYVRKAVIGIVALVAVPLGLAVKGFVAWCAMPRV
jgi:hypothetical protein